MPKATPGPLHIPPVLPLYLLIFPCFFFFSSSSTCNALLPSPHWTSFSPNLQIQAKLISSRKNLFGPLDQIKLCYHVFLLIMPLSSCCQLSFVMYVGGFYTFSGIFTVTYILINTKITEIEIFKN